MRDLPPEARELLARVRAEQPRSTPTTRARVRRGVADAIASSRTPELDALAPVTTTKTTQYASALKLATVTLLVGITGALLFRSARHEAVTPPAPEASAPELAPHRAEPPGAEPPSMPPPAVSQAGQATNPTHPAGKPSAAAAPSLPRLHEPKESLGTELRLVRFADQALRAGDAAGALKALTAQRARFGSNGQLAHERKELTLLAECALGTPGASARASTYLRQHPSSLVQERLVNACALRETP